MKQYCLSELCTFLLMHFETFITLGWQDIYLWNEFTSSLTFPQNSSRDWKGSTKARYLNIKPSSPFAKRTLVSWWTVISDIGLQLKKKLYCVKALEWFSCTHHFISFPFVMWYKHFKTLHQPLPLLTSGLTVRCLKIFKFFTTRERSCWHSDSKTDLWNCKNQETRLKQQKCPIKKCV